MCCAEVPPANLSIANSATFSLAAWKPHKDVFEEDALVARRKHSVTPQASNLTAVRPTGGFDCDNFARRTAARTVEGNRLKVIHGRWKRSRDKKKQMPARAANH